MAIDHHFPHPTKTHRLPISQYIDFIRWLPAPSPFQKSFLLASFKTDTHSPSLQTLSLNNADIHSNDNPTKPPPITPTASWTPPARVTSLASTPTLIGASTRCGSVHVFLASVSVGVMEPVVSVGGPGDRGFHAGSIEGLDLIEGGRECVCVGEDGRVNLVGVGREGGSGGYRRIFDGNGLVSYTAVKWASASEFVTGGVGFGLQWWDLRRPGSAVAQFKGNWDKGTTSGIIHSIDIHPSRKHTCLAGGSSGTVFAWDLRWQQQPVILSGGRVGNAMTRSLSESEVWEVQYDCYMKSSNSNISSSRILPAMICSEDGILAVIEQGEEPIELLAEPCAINSFDIDRQNPSDVICSLEWESVAILSRP